jgi:RNA polymerase-binding protein DksA
VAKASAKKTSAGKSRKPAAKPVAAKATKPVGKSKPAPARPGKTTKKTSVTKTAAAKPAPVKSVPLKLPPPRPVSSKPATGKSPDRLASSKPAATAGKPTVATAKSPAAKSPAAKSPAKSAPGKPDVARPAATVAPAAAKVNGTRSAGKHAPAPAPAARPVNGKPAADGVKKTLVLVQSSDIKIKRPASVVAAATPAPRPRPVIDRMRPPEPVARYEPVKLPPQGSGDIKPRKNRAGLTTKELAVFRDLLLAKRRELVGDMSSMEREALRSQGSNLSNLPMHMADMGTDNYEQEFTLGLVEKDRSLLREINIALAKILDGSYGICEGTGQPIAKPRLEAQPWAKYGIEYARLLERGLVRRPM